MPRKGQKTSEEIKRKISEARRGHFTSEATKRKISLAHTGKTHSKETKEKMSRVRLMPEHRKRHSAVMKEAHARGCYTDVYTDEVRKKMSVSIRAARANGCSRGGHARPSSLECLMYSACKSLGIKFIREYRIPEDSRYYDLYLPRFNLLIEVQGIYWHTRGWAIERDIQKHAFAQNSGYRYAAIWDHELENPGLALSNAIIRRING